MTDYLVDLVNNPNFVSDADGSGLSGLRDGSVKAMFSGSWDASAVKEALGDNYGVVQLPTITINGNYWDRNQLSLAGMNNKTGIIASLGLKENEVGQKGTMPSIGESGKPISLTTGE